MQLNNQFLLKNQCLINGQWVENGAHRIKVFNPSNGELIESVPSVSETQISFAISSASKAIETWKHLAADERSILLRKWYSLIMANESDLAQIMSNEQGKPIEEALQEVRYGASYVEWFAEEAKRINGDILPGKSVNNRIFVTKEPVGVCGLITPWNFPNAMIARKMAPALAAGCTIIAKPSEETPLSAFALAELACVAGFPKGVINIITGDAKKIGEFLTSSPLVHKISFTGSTKVGEVLKAQCIPTHKRTSMELGGNAPFIIFNDANLEKAVHSLMHAKFRNSGQTCISANRVLVQKKIFPQFIEAVKQAVSELIIGDPYVQDVKIGPLINEVAVKKVDRLVQDAIRNGAELIVGGQVSELGSCFYEPTILIDIRSDMAIFNEEIFGPVLAILTFDEEEEILELANHTNAGLAAYLFTKDVTRIFRISRELQFGMIGVNTGSISYASVPFGGAKYSGEGREGSKYGIEEYLELKSIVLTSV
ncbi:MAG: aldehyde dehydrogenase family protein [Neisseriaceae bacterium]|nr:MAG: aldehyde dehydrogenase family protein [Neisseriaceae bacterium]